MFTDEKDLFKDHINGVSFIYENKLIQIYYGSESGFNEFNFIISGLEIINIESDIAQNITYSLVENIALYYMYAAGIGIIIAGAINYIVNRRWTFGIKF